MVYASARSHREDDRLRQAENRLSSVELCCGWVISMFECRLRQCNRLFLRQARFFSLYFLDTVGTGVRTLE